MTFGSGGGRRARGLALAVLIGAGAALGVPRVASSFFGSSTPETPAPPTVTLPDFRTLVERVSPAVVNISTKSGPHGSGMEGGPGADPVALSFDGSKEPAAPTTKAPRGVTFPRGVSSKFSNETPAKARMHTCLEQYYANKERDSLGGLKWIQKGGGYYSLCNARLKTSS